MAPASAGPLAKPALAFAMRPALTSDLLSPEIHADLARLCTILSDEPLTEFSSAPAQSMLSRVEILFTGWGCPRIDAEVLARAPKLRLIAHSASSVKPIVDPAAWQRGVTVVSAAAANGIPVAEYTLAAILLANKGAFAVRERYRRERQPWRLPWTAPCETGNFGAVVGIVGASRIGRRLLELLRPFDLRVLVFDPFVTAADAASLGATGVSLEVLLQESNIVTLHAPALPETQHMIGRRELGLMRDGTTIINTARGPLVDHAALERELVSGRLNAILDVSDPEPLPPSSVLFDLPNVFLTPHIAGAAGKETQRMARLVVEEIGRFVAGQALHHEITADALARIG